MGTHASDRAEPVSFGSPHFSSIEVGGLLVTDATFTPGSRLSPHVHDRTCVATTLQGRFASGMRGRSYWSEPSAVLTEPAGERHDNEFGTGGARVLIVQPDAAREVFRPCSRFLESISHFRDARIGVLAHRITLEIARPDGVTPLVVEALGQELLATAARSLSSTGRERNPPAWLRRVRDRLHDTFSETLTLDGLAETAGVHPAHVAKMFRRHHGCSVGAYQRELRLDWTARRLRATEDPLSAIAADAGYSDQSHFTRSFKARFGCTPSDFRSRGRGCRAQGLT